MEYFVSPLVSRLRDTLSGLVKEELHLILGVPEEIQKLCSTLRWIQAVLNDAEQQQITQEAVKLWLSNLRDVMYDADDILDEYRIVAEETASLEPSICNWILHFLGRFCQTHEIGSKIRNLYLRLEQISVGRSKFDLKVDTRVRKRQKVVPRVSRETSSTVEPDIVGEAIEKDTKDLVDWLKKEQEKANSNVVVLAILGIGGIGKTTLAQKIFNNDDIKAVFRMTMWVCVSQEFVEMDLLRRMITSAGRNPGEARSKADLEDKVMHLLKDKKFFLVLDDVWDAQIWEDLLRKLLQVGAIGSRVLVTTRNQRVAQRMKAIRIHNVNPLPLDESWLLLCKKVTKNAEEEREVERLKDIGMKIVEKCQGLPLAITTIGGVLCGEFKRWKWQEVERSSAWSRTGLPDGVHQALYLSYEDLPSHLKQCFLYCSLFREDYYFFRHSLAQLWVAEGLVIEVEGEENLSLEEIAQGYYDDLVQRSLLQAYQDEPEGVLEIAHGYCDALVQRSVLMYCKMHDLLRSLCHFLARGENSVITDIYKHTADDDSIKLRRLSIVAPESQDIKPLLPSIKCNKSVRTLLLRNIRTLDDMDVEDCFNNFQRLRVVHLGATMIQSLPQSVGNLLHLRYLNLFGCKNVKALPESIASLKYLQFLILLWCTNLYTLPKGVVKLRNLRTLDLAGVPLTELPSGIARLENLNLLRGAVVSSISSDSSSSSSCSLEEISQLRQLRMLSIRILGKTSAESDPNVNGLNSSLTAFNNLEHLTLSCGPEQQEASDTEETSYMEETDSPHILESGQQQQVASDTEEKTDSPHILESGQQEASYTKEETDSPHILELGQQVASDTEEKTDSPHSLQSGQQEASYTEEETDRIEKIFDVALHPPSCVRKIHINSFFGRQFPQWLWSNSISSLLPNLTDLRLMKCHCCSRLPPLGKLPNLELLELGMLDAVRTIDAEFFGYKEASTSVGHESGGSKSAPSSLALFPRLKRLHLELLSNLEAWHWVLEDGGTVAMPQLNELVITRCPKLLSLPVGLNHQATRLIKLYISCNGKINSINRFPSVKTLMLYDEESLKIVSHLPALEVLKVRLNQKQTLSLPDWLVQGLPHFTSLQRLILKCRNKKLLYRCLQDGPDWPYIRHIPIVHISDFHGNYINQMAT